VLAPAHGFARLARAASRLALAAWIGSLGRLAQAEPNELSARLVCPQRPGPGRLVCEAELEVETGVLAWADVLVVEAPPFARPLRARVGPGGLFMKSEQRQRLQLALAATAPGSGQLRVRARAVICTDSERRTCRPVVVSAEARVLVGPISE
jgi:hypothetical protein